MGSIWKATNIAPKIVYFASKVNKGNNKITELRTILQRESPNSVNNRKTVKTVMT
jgi:hypothetical protein